MKKKNCLFVTYTEYYTEYNQQWNVFSAFNPSECTHTHLEQRAASGAAPGGQLGVRCLAQGSHLSRGQFLPRSIRATTAPLYMMPYTVLGVSFLISWTLQEQLIICHDDIRANRWQCCWSHALLFAVKRYPVAKCVEKSYMTVIVWLRCAVYIALHNATKIKILHMSQRVSSPKNENCIINYSPSCRSKPVSPSFIFGTQINIFFMNLRALWPSIDSKDPYTIIAQTCSKDIGKIIHVTSGVQPQFYEATRIIFVCKENKNNIIYWIKYYFWIFLESTPERNQCNQRFLRFVNTVHMLNVNNAHHIDYSPKWRKTVTRGKELFNKLCHYCFLCT